MNYLYFAHDWVIEKEEISKVLSLIYLAISLECDLRGVYVESQEGYQIERFVIRLPSQEVFEKFKISAHRIGLHSWLSVNSDYYKMISFVKGQPLGRLNDLPENILIESYRNQVHLNKQIQEKFHQSEPLCYRCDWIPADPLSRDWLDKITSLSNGLGLGCGLRLGTRWQNEEGFYVQPLILRVFSQREFETFKNRIREIASLTAWRCVFHKQYLDAKPVTWFELDSLQIQLEEIAVSNSRRNR